VGAQPYQGLEAATETVVARGIPASIQLDRAGDRPLGGLPGDATGRGMWKIMVPKASLAKGVVLDQDVVTDDQNLRYQVTNPYWDSLGYALRVERLKT
jgi:hypothetical protein